MMALDKFSVSVPSFNFKGHQSIRTGLGACCSIAITVIVLFYALLKFIQLHERHNPTIAAFPVAAKFDIENPINLNAINFRAAFALYGFNFQTQSIEYKDDPSYVKMIIR